MSAGDPHKHGVTPGEMHTVVSRAAVQKELDKPFTLNREYDLPYLAGYSQDGKTIYIDRHLPKALKIDGKSVDVTPFLIEHERVEKALIDQLGYGYWKAHWNATEAEEEKVVAAGFKRAPYEAVLKPYIKADDRERIVKIPPDLDLTPYKAKPVDREMLAHIERLMKMEKAA